MISSARKGSTGQVIAHMSLRATRVVLLVPEGGDWKLMARKGIYAINEYWGGAGFVVVPVTTSDVDPAVLASLRAYDPDLVVVPPADHTIAVSDREMLERAQEAISAACSNYRSPNADSVSIAQPKAANLAEPYLHESGLIPVTRLNRVTQEQEVISTVGANAAVGGSLGLAAAYRWGLSTWPDSGQQEEHVDDALARRAIWRPASAADH